MSKPLKEVVVTSGDEGFAQRVQARTHTLSADEPADVGGADTGPDPYELLLASVGSCSAITVQMYARRKEWPLEKVTVRLSHQKVHAEDCGDCEQETGTVDVIEKQVEVTGDLSDAQRTKLIEIADKCPVHRSIERGVKVRPIQNA